MRLIIRSNLMWYPLNDRVLTWLIIFQSCLMAISESSLLLILQLVGLLSGLSRPLLIRRLHSFSIRIFLWTMKHPMSFYQITVLIYWLILSSIMFGCWSQLIRLLHLTIPKQMVKWKISIDYSAICLPSIFLTNQLASGMNTFTKPYLLPGFVPMPWLIIVPSTSCMMSTHVYCLMLIYLMTSTPLRRIRNPVYSISVMLGH